jgi:hypothetical protein
MFHAISCDGWRLILQFSLYKFIKFFFYFLVRLAGKQADYYNKDYRYDKGREQLIQINVLFFMKLRQTRTEMPPANMPANVPCQFILFQ